MSGNAGKTARDVSALVMQKLGGVDFLVCLRGQYWAHVSSGMELRVYHFSELGPSTAPSSTPPQLLNNC